MFQDKSRVSALGVSEVLVRPDSVAGAPQSFQSHQPAFEAAFNRQTENLPMQDLNARVLNKAMVTPGSEMLPPVSTGKFLVTIQEYFKNALVAGSVASTEHKSVDKVSSKGLHPSVTGAKYTTAIQKAVTAASEKYGVNKRLIESVIKQESNFNPNAVSKAGAKGLMQLMPGTAKEVGVKNTFDIDQNVDGGTQYLKKMLDLFGGDQRKALAAYNAGPGAVKKHGGVPPYAETRKYVARIMNMFNEKLS